MGGGDGEEWREKERGEKSMQLLETLMPPPPPSKYHSYLYIGLDLKVEFSFSISGLQCLVKSSVTRGWEGVNSLVCRSTRSLRAWVQG